MRQFRPAKLKIDLNALRHNATIAKTVSNNALVMSAIKANAYGHGILQTANALKDIVDEFAVASLDDVIQIRQNSPACDHVPITILSGFYSAAEIPKAIQYNASLVVYEEQQIDYLLSCDYTKFQTKLDVWLKVDTGMNRLGIQLEKFQHHSQQLELIEGLNIRGVISHFANADESDHALNAKQINRFEQLRASYEQKNWLWSFANSAAILGLQESHYDWVRPGIMLYGGSPLAGKDAALLGLKPVMTFSSKVISLREVKSGQSIGYGSLWTAKKDTKVAVVACGYGDGYPRCIQENTPILVAGQSTVILGRVSMDLLIADVTDLNVENDSEVILWGQGLPVEEVAESVGTISYELFCGVTERVAREYQDS